MLPKKLPDGTFLWKRLVTCLSRSGGKRDGCHGPIADLRSIVPLLLIPHCDVVWWMPSFPSVTSLWRPIYLCVRAAEAVAAVGKWSNTLSSSPALYIVFDCHDPCRFWVSQQKCQISCWSPSDRILTENKAKKTWTKQISSLTDTWG